MSNLIPGTWIECKLGDVVAIVRGVTFPASSKVHEPTDGYVACLRTSHIQEKLLWKNIYYIPNSYVKGTDRLAKRNDILMSMANSSNLVGKVCIKETDREACFGAFLSAIRSEVISHAYVYYFLKSSTAQQSLRSSASQTVNIANISVAALENLLLPLAPLAEQTRIAAKLDELLAQVDTLKARIDSIPALLKRFRQSVLAAAVSGRLTEEWRAKNGAKIEVNVSAGETSEEFAWPIVRLGDVALDFSYGSSAKSQRAGDIPVLRMGNIQDGRLVWDDLVFSSNPEELKKYSLQVGDVLFNRTNSPELVGKTATYKGEQPAIYAGYLIRVRCSEHLISDFLNYCLNSPQGKDYCWQVKTDGVSQSNINAKKLADFRFGLPSTEEQTEIVRCVDQLFSFAERLEARISDARIRIDRLTQSILAKALRGDLVPQDPNDEPADLLLDRIKAQRAAAPKDKRGRRSTTED